MDNHPSFLAKELQAITRLMGTKRRYSHAYSSESHGKVERLNQEVMRLLAALRLEEYGEDWAANLFLAEHALNTTVSMVTGFSPFELMLGEKQQMRGIAEWPRLFMN
jgi:hypothetical protein